MEEYLKDMTDQVYPYKDCKIFKMAGVPQEFSFGALFWDDSSDTPRLRIWIDGMERERDCPRAFTPDEIRAGLDHGVGHPSSQWPRQKHLTT
jgi:hypothetical protein